MFCSFLRALDKRLFCVKLIDLRLKMIIFCFFSLGPSDVKQVHSSSVNWDIKKPAESGNALSTPSSLKTTTSNIWTSDATLGNTSAGGGKTVEVTFSLQVPDNVSISTSPASPSKGSGPKVGSSQSTQEKKVLKPGPQLLAGVKDPFWSPNASDKDSSKVKPSEKEGSGAQTPGIGHRSALDRVTEEPVGKQSWVQGKSSIATGQCVPVDNSTASNPTSSFSQQ